MLCFLSEERQCSEKEEKRGCLIGIGYLMEILMTRVEDKKGREMGRWTEIPEQGGQANERKEYCTRKRINIHPNRDASWRSWGAQKNRHNRT